MTKMDGSRSPALARHIEYTRERSRLLRNEMVRQEEAAVRRELRLRVLEEQNAAAVADGLELVWAAS